MDDHPIPTAARCGGILQADSLDKNDKHNDKFLTPGQYRELERALARHPECEEIATGVFYAFDFRTRLGPFLFVDRRLPPAGVLSLGACLLASGFRRTRVVLQQWARNVRPSDSRIDGRPLEMVLVSAMQLHSAPAYQLIADAWSMGENRPLILAGGPKATYEPWDMFSPNGPSADVVVTGEEPVLLELLGRLLEFRGRTGTMREAFEKAKRAGALTDIRGLVYRIDDGRADQVELLDTGKQRLLRDLDELPDPLLGYRVLEPPHRSARMAPRPLPLERVHKHARVLPVVTTHGCKFACPYCPIPDYNHRTFRYKSPSRLRWEIQRLAEEIGVTSFFGTDDNMFNDHQVVAETFAEMAKGKVHGKPFRRSIHFATEATLFDVWRCKEILPLCRKGGLRAIWFGIEDMTAGLVKKGQSAERVEQLFPLMRRWGIWPMPMLMHYEGQPLFTRGNLRGLANQVAFLAKHGAGTVQVTFLTPAVGTKLYDEPFLRKSVAKRVGGRIVEDCHYDGNHVIACDPRHAFRHQLNLLAAYLAFYNPVNLARKLTRLRDSMNLYDVNLQVSGMVGWLRSVWVMKSWLWRMWLGPTETYDGPRRPPWKIYSVEQVLQTAGEAAQKYLDPLGHWTPATTTTHASV